MHLTVLGRTGRFSSLLRYRRNSPNLASAALFQWPRV
jgi:hypothetical protein